MKISIKELRSLIREAVDKSYVDPHYARLKSLAKGAIADLKAGGVPEDVYTWLAAETDLGRGQHRADAVVVLVRKVDPAAAADLEHAGRDFRSAPAPYIAPWSGTSGKMYESAVGATVLYHGTLRGRVPSILATGLRATEGWGGAPKPGVFLSPTREDAEYWGTAGLLKAMGLPVPQGAELAPPPGTEGEVVVLAVTIPPDALGTIVPRRKSFSLPGDVQFVGSIPPEWISID